MWEIAMAITIWASPPQRPYVSCIDGHIVTSYDKCPQVSKHNGNQSPPVGGGPTSRGGLLGLGIGGIL